MPPPAANHRTAPDGTLSPAGERGKEAYNGKAGCDSCHSLPLSTNNLTMDEGITFDQTSTPALVGVYRHGVWMKHGESTEFSTAVDDVLRWMGNTQLSSDEQEDLLVYLEEELSTVAKVNEISEAKNAK